MIGLPSIPQPEEQNSGLTPEMENKVKGLMQSLSTAIRKDDESDDQSHLIEVIQLNRALLLDSAMMSYLNKPGHSKLLESVISLLAGMEKAVRDDRKEAAKKKELLTNTVAFTNMLDALKEISTGRITIPTFDMGDFVLDPSKSLIEGDEEIGEIKEAELEQGNFLVDLEGNRI